MQRLYPMYTLHKAFKQCGLTLDFAGVMSTHDKARAASVPALIASHSRVTIGAVFSALSTHDKIRAAPVLASIASHSRVTIDAVCLSLCKAA